MSACRGTLKDVIKTHSIQVATDTSFEDFQEQLQDKADKQIEDIKEHMRYCLICNSHISMYIGIGTSEYASVVTL